MKSSIGIDISKDSFDVVIYDGNTYESSNYSYTDKVILTFIKFIRTVDQDNLIITMEATGI
jgi:transposase